MKRLINQLKKINIIKDYMNLMLLIVVLRPVFNLEYFLYKNIVSISLKKFVIAVNAILSGENMSNHILVQFKSYTFVVFYTVVILFELTEFVKEG